MHAIVKGYDSTSLNDRPWMRASPNLNLDPGTAGLSYMSENVRQKRLSWPATVALRLMHSPMIDVFDSSGVTEVSQMVVSVSATLS